MSVADLADPRSWPAAHDDGFGGRLHAAVDGAVAAATHRETEALDDSARAMLASALADRSGRTLAKAFASAPSLSAARHLRRLLAGMERADPGDALATALFALPVIVVGALETREEPVTLPGVLPDPGALAELLRHARAFGGSEAFGLSGALAGVDAIDLGALPALLAQAAPGLSRAPLDLAPAPIEIRDRSEHVHLRFVAGAVLTTSRDPFAEPNIARWGMPFAQAITHALRVPRISLLALPRPARRLVQAVQAGRAAQREVAAQLFASNAIRKFRASLGEPTAMVSAHRAADAPGGGELRLSLSSPFAEKEAEGFRCPVYPYEAVGDVAQMLHALMRDCRVADVRFLPGVHGDIDPVVGGPLFFKSRGAAQIH